MSEYKIENFQSLLAERNSNFQILKQLIQDVQVSVPAIISAVKSRDAADFVKVLNIDAGLISTFSRMNAYFLGYTLNSQDNYGFGFKFYRKI